jgi:hypothetical protein
VIVVVPDEVEADALYQALRRGGFKLRAAPGGIFHLYQVRPGRPLCEVPSCEAGASVRTKTQELCAAHAAEVLP